MTTINTFSLPKATIYIGQAEKALAEENRLDLDACKIAFLDGGVALVGKSETGLDPRVRAYLGPKGDGYAYPLEIQTTPGYLPSDYAEYLLCESASCALPDDAREILEIAYVTEMLLAQERSLDSGMNSVLDGSEDQG